MLLKAFGTKRVLNLFPRSPRATSKKKGLCISLMDILFLFLVLKTGFCESQDDLEFLILFPLGLQA